MVRGRAPEFDCVGLVVVARPGEMTASTTWVPPELSAMLLSDHDTAIARALGVRLVPLASFITSKGTVVSRALGEESASALKKHLIELHRTSSGTRGAH
jgi:hypothetical protein